MRRELDYARESFLRACNAVRAQEQGYFAIAMKRDPTETRLAQDRLRAARVVKQQAFDALQAAKASYRPRAPVVRL